MRIFACLSVLALTSLPAVPAAAAPPVFDPGSLKSSVHGPKTQVLVLGTAHLAQIPPGGYQSDMLAPVLDRLAGYAPTLIATEAMSGEACQIAATFKVPYADVADTYCERQFAIAALGFKTTGLDVAAAAAQANAELATWPANPTPAQRRHLAALFAASGDFGSALVQWLRLPASEAREGDGLSPELVAKLQDLKGNPNEVVQIAAVLAVRLGLDRLYASDDHTADSIHNAAPEGYGEAIQALWKLPDAYSADYRTRVSNLKSSDNVLSLFQVLNSPEGQAGVVNGEWKNALAQNSPQLYGRQYVAWWETRNLRIAANLRASFGNQPGGRVLLIIGASHKPYLDAYMHMMHEVEIVDAAEVLR
ncbi:DUF5694 domain-containing protein [Asticcacaulis biprosthecium]|uniref:DUF5694 domain-containing protein n=1 Tax=Asticcacaulis biprosthecium TaxID=76891 RepID=UPI0002FA24BD|nr:DUF5694 domain-containing protein [Asticcacaulis biprosthecium]